MPISCNFVESKVLLEPEQQLIKASHYKSIAEVLSPYFIMESLEQQPYLPLAASHNTATSKVNSKPSKTTTVRPPSP